MEFKQRRELKRTRIEIIPMIDTMFFLLVFFMLSSLALAKLNGLPVNLPKASTSVQQPNAQFTVTVDKHHRIYVNKEEVAQESLGASLAEKVAAQHADLSSASVIINADMSVPHGIVVHCINEARRIGISHFSIATDPDIDTK